MLPDAWIIAVIGVVLGILAIPFWMLLTHPVKFEQSLGECPSCKSRLIKATMSDGPCLDAKFYCKECLRAGTCGCDNAAG